MAAAKKKTYVKYKTPIGVAVYPKLDKAYKWDDASDRSLPNPDGDYTTRLRLSRKDAQEVIDLVQKAIKEAGVKPKHLPYEDEVVDDEKTGNVLIKLKAYGKTKDGDINKIKFYDSAGHPLPGVVRVTGGSRIRLLGWISVAKMGARLNIREVQIIDLAELEGEGFEAVEGGSFRRDLGDDDTVENENETTETSETEATSADEDEEF